MSEDAVSRRRRRSHGSADPALELFTSCVRFSKCSRDLEARKFFRKRNMIFWGRLGVPPIVAPEGGSVLARAKPRLTQYCARAFEPLRVRATPEEFKGKAYFFISPRNLRYKYKVCTNDLEFQG